MNKLTLGALLFSAAMLVSGAPGKSKTYTVTADAEWHPLVYDMTKTVIPGSALDLSRDGVKPIERVVIRNGQFYRESEPDRLLLHNSRLRLSLPHSCSVFQKSAGLSEGKNNAGAVEGDSPHSCKGIAETRIQYDPH